MKMDAPELHYECDGDVVVYKRPNSKTPNYYARIKLPKIGKWKKFTTGTSDLNEAISIAIDEYKTIKIKLENGIVLDTRSFRHVADVAIKEMKEQLEAGIGKVSFHDYIRQIERYKEFFGNKYVSNITYDDLARYDEFRTQQLGRKASSSTINTHNAALARVFDLAVRKGWLHQSQVISFKNDGRKVKRRPYFELREYQALYRFLRQYVKRTTKDSSKGGVTNRSLMVRELLRDYVLFLTNTGIRHGTEALNLRWKDISEHTDGDAAYLRINIEKGKTGARTIIARHNTRKYLDRIRSRFSELAELSDKELARNNEKVFRLADGSIPKDLHGAFHRVLEEAGLLFDNNGNKRSLYSLRHTYATFQILYNKHIDFHTLAKNMGTSIAMLEKHYSHLEVIHKADVLAGQQDKSFRKRLL